jgi:uncharacterized membrane protein
MYKRGCFQMNPVHIHLLLNHVPVLGGLLSLVLLVIGVVTKSRATGRIALGLLVFSALVAIPVFLTGEPSEEVLEGLAGISENLVEQHEDSGKIAMAAIGVSGLLGAFALVLMRREQVLPKWLMASLIGLLLVSNALMIRTAGLGGQIRHSEIRSGNQEMVLPVGEAGHEGGEHD